MKRYFLIAWIGICMAAAAAVGSVAATGLQRLDVQLIPHSKSPNLASSVITVTIRNVSGATVYLPKVSTPLFTPDDHLQNNVFDVTDSKGHIAPFIGRYVHVIPGEPDSYFLKLRPGESLSHDLDLAADYDLSNGGTFTVKYDQQYSTDVLVGARGDIESPSIFEPSEVVHVYVGRANKAALLVPAVANPGTVCNSDQMKSIGAALGASIPLVLKAYQGITALYYNEQGTDQYGQKSYTGKLKQDNSYTYWFGAPENKNTPEPSTRNYTQFWKDSDDYVMMYTMNSVYLRLPGGKFLCACPATYDPRSAAWTESPTRTVHICDFFFTLPASDGPYDSQVLTVIHEVSHYADSYAPPTGDYIYGRTGSHDLTTGNRSRAVRNADNIMYYIGTYNTTAH